MSSESRLTSSSITTASDSPRSGKAALRIDTSLAAGVLVGGSIAEAARDKARRQELSENRRRLVNQEQERLARRQREHAATTSGVSTADTVIDSMFTGSPPRGLGSDDHHHPGHIDASQQHQHQQQQPHSQLQLHSHYGNHQYSSTGSSLHDGGLYDNSQDMDTDDQHLMMVQQSGLEQQQQQQLEGGIDDDVEEVDDEEEEDDDDDELSSSPSIPDDNIDFDLVYALHTFLATVEGQASVVKGDQLTLLDDSNSYWWLVRVLKTQAVGYIPAENIETPYERLARLNKHRNVDLAFATQDDLLTGTGSSLAQTKFANPHHPLNRAVKQGASRLPPQLNLELPGKGRFVDFAPPTYHEHEGAYYGSGTEDEDEEGGFDDEEEEDPEGDHSNLEEADYDEEEGNEAMHEQNLHEQSAQSHQYADGQSFNPGTADEESDGSFEGATPHVVDAHAQLHASQTPSRPSDSYNALDDLAAAASQASVHPVSATINRNAQAKAQAALGVGRPTHLQSPQILQDGFVTQPALQSASRQPSLIRKPSIDEQLRAEHEATLRGSPRRQSSLQAITPAALPQKSPQRQASLSSLSEMRPSSQAPQPGPLSVLQPRSASAASQNSLTHVVASPSSNQSLRLKPFPAEETEIVATSFDGSASSAPGEPRKISLTPRIAREMSIESGLSDRALSPTPSNASSTNRMHGLGFGDIGSPQSQQHLHQYGHSTASQARGSARSGSASSGGHSEPNTVATSTNSQPAGFSHDDASSSAPQPRRVSASSAASVGSSQLHGEKRAASPYASDSDTNKSGSSKDKDTKKKKSSGILGGLFNRGSKKEKDRDKEKDSPRDNKPVKRSDSKRGSPGSHGDTARSASPHGMSRASDRDVQSAYATAPGGLVTQQLQARRAMEDMFGNYATRRQQQIEAQNAMYQQYGIHPRAQGERVNTQTFSDARAGPPGSVSMSSIQAVATPPMHQSPQMHLLQTPDMLQQGRSPSSGASPIATSSISSAVSSVGIGSNSFSGRSLRPGSLIGSPHVTTALSGQEVSTLNVLRIFAGDNIDSEATFKTVLLNESTSAEELVKQAMQRFHLTPSTTGPDGSLVSAMMSEYYLVAKESSGDETVIQVNQKPLQVFEGLVNISNAAQNRYMMPSVKRSSVGSFDSVASNLSMHPAIEKLRMNDFFDDSSVKLFINKRTRSSTAKKSVTRTSSLVAKGDNSGSDEQQDKITKRGSSDIIEESALAAAPLVRFAVQVHIYQEDLPDSMAFDPLSPVLIPRSSLADRQQAAMSRSSSTSSTIARDHREKIIFFPRNASVLEVLETALDRFGIVEGVVDGGDAVEDKLMKRRSMGRTRYCLTVGKSGHGYGDNDLVLNASSKLLQAYSIQPMFKGYDRTSKEFRRRSMDAPYNTPTASDIQPSDPIFIIRKANNRLSTETLKAAVVDKPLHSNVTKPILEPGYSSTSVCAASMSEIVPEVQDKLVPQFSQPPAKSSGSLAKYTAQPNTESGIDVALPDKSFMRSSRDLTSGNHRYSYVSSDGQVQDISEIINQEWHTTDMNREFNEPIRNSPSVLSHVTADSFTSALESPGTPMISAMSLGKGVASLQNPLAGVSQDHLSGIPQDFGTSRDFLNDVLSCNDTSPSMAAESANNVNERIDRVLAKINAHGHNSGGIATALRKTQSQGIRPSGDADAPVQCGPSAGNIARPASSSAPGRSTPIPSSSRKDDAQSSNRYRSGSSSSSFRASPTLQSMRSTPQLEAPPSSASSTPKQPAGRVGHTKQPSIASVASDASSSQSTSSPATPSGNTVSTSMSSARATSSLGTSHGRLPIMYNDDDGIDYLLTIADMAARPRIARELQPLSVLDILSDVPFPTLPPEIAITYDKSRKRIEALEARLDRLLDQVMNQ